MALSIKKHPVHLMLVSFPIALFTFSLISDLIYFFGGGGNWTMVAYYTMGGGVLFALLAAIPGFIDLYNMPTGVKAKQLGIWHMGLNLGIVTLFALNFYIRGIVGGGTVVPFIMSVLGVSALLVSGWLGGEMVFHYGAGIDLEEEEPSGEVVEIKRGEPSAGHEEHKKAA